jgi:hypothetical protein
MFTKLSFIPQDSAALAIELHPRDSLAQFRFVKASEEVRTFSSHEIALEEWNRLKSEGTLETVGDNMKIAYKGYHVYRVFK